jgi:hypothetical protein
MTEYRTACGHVGLHLNLEEVGMPGFAQFYIWRCGICRTESPVMAFGYSLAAVRRVQEAYDAHKQGA